MELRNYIKFILFATLGIVYSPANAEPKVVPIDGVNYIVAHSINDNLKMLLGKKVSLTLKSGKTITGLVKQIGEDLIHIEKLEDREYYDALIRSSEVSAIETRFRTVER